MATARIPDPVRRGVSRTLRTADGPGPEITDARSIGGGCINPSARLETSDGASYFLKWNEDNPGLFPAEADGLGALADAASGGPLRIPDVVGVGGGSGGEPGWLLLKFVTEGPGGDSYAGALGRGLARLHRDVGDAWGWDEDNFIGSLPQSNGPRDGWADFWIEERLRPQLERARQTGRIPGTEADWKTLFEKMPELVGPAEDEGPSLLHGDLWSGNVYPDADGTPVLIDPAVYRGHREVDLAMTELFGGFPERFYRAYDEAWPLEPGWAGVRRPLYQLYPLLVHVNLFGGGYAGRTERTLRTVLAGG